MYMYVHDVHGHDVGTNRPAASHPHNYVYGGKSLEHVQRSQCDRHERVGGDVWRLVALDHLGNEPLSLGRRQLVCLDRLVAVKTERGEGVLLEGGRLGGREGGRMGGWER